MNSRERVRKALNHQELDQISLDLGDRLDTKKTLPFGTQDEVRTEVRARIEEVRPGGGWIFNTVLNVIANYTVT